MAGKSNKAKKGKGASPNSGPANATEPESKPGEPSVVVSDCSPTDTNPPNGEANGEIGNTDTEVHTDEAPAAVKEEEANEKLSPGKQREGSALVYCEFFFCIISNRLVFSGI
jgi:hypothetical protein